MKPSPAPNINHSKVVHETEASLGVSIPSAYEQRSRQWIQQNVDFVIAYNHRVETEGVALEEWRAF